MNDLIERQAAVEAVGLGMRLRGHRILDDCSFRVPAGRVCGLVGPNGAGKSTLLALAAGLLQPTEGTVRLSGHAPDTDEARGGTAFLAQDKPLYARFTVADMLSLGRDLNPGWQESLAQELVGFGDLPAKARIGTLSGGQRTRVALALALGKAPSLLLLDEPLVALDPLSRRQVMGVLMADAAERGTTIVMSSHVIDELEEVIDYLVLIDGGRVRLAGETETIMESHRLVVGPATTPDRPDPLPARDLVEDRVSGRRRTALVRTPDRPPYTPPPGAEWQVSEPTLEELLLSYLRSPQAPALLTASADSAAAEVVPV